MLLLHDDDGPSVPPAEDVDYDEYMRRNKPTSVSYTHLFLHIWIEHEHARAKERDCNVHRESLA